MPVQCRMIDDENTEVRDRKPGDMFYADYLFIEEIGKYHFVSKQFDRDWAGKRHPIVVVLPNGETFMPDAPYGMDMERREGWTVTGEAPNITVSPSINCVGRYHGWLQNGVLSDDIEGRIY